MSLYATAVKKPVTTALVFVAIVIFGLFSLTRLSVDLLPEIETNTIMVMTSYAGASAADIEMNVSKPLENVLNSVSDLKHITSQSRENISIITLAYIIHSGFISGYQNRYGDNLKPPTNVYHRMTA